MVVIPAELETEEVNIPTGEPEAMDVAVPVAQNLDDPKHIIMCCLNTENPVAIAVEKSSKLPMSLRTASVWMPPVWIHLKAVGPMNLDSGEDDDIPWRTCPPLG